MPKETCPDLQLQSDEPIATPEDDSLERKGLTESIAAKILSRDTSSCLIVGISGPWGSGKTSLLSLIEGRIQKEAAKRTGILVLRFNPWSYSTIDQLITAFFRDLRSTLSLIDKTALADSIGEALEKLALALIPLSMVPSLQPAAAVSLVISPIAKMMRNAAKSKPLAKIKEDLNGYLRDAGIHLVILIDDLDRAEPECVRLMLQLIRMNADFSGTTYVLAFDRDRTAKALSTSLRGSEEDGQDYLGKLIQVPFELPILETLRLKVEVADAVKPLFEIIFNEPDLMKRHREMMDARFYDLFDNVRDAKRFANALAVTMPIVWDEVNPVDFAVLEALRLKCPKLHEKLHGYRWLLLNESRGLEEAVRSVMNQNMPDREGHRTAYKTLLGVLASPHRDVADSLLKALFPQLARLAFEQSTWDAPFDAAWSQKRLVCSMDHFDSYFFLSPGIQSVSEKELSGALSLTDDREALANMLLKLDKEGKAEQMLRRFSMRAEDLSPAEIEVAICALLDVGDSFPGWGHPDRDPTSAVRISLYLTTLTRAITAPDELMEILSRCVSSGKGICSVVRFVNSVLDIAFEGKPTLSKTRQEELKRLACERIEAAIAENELLRSPRPVFVLYRWDEWDHESASRYVTELTQKDAGLLDLLQSFQRSGGTYSDSSGYVAPDHNALAKIIRGLVPDDELNQAASRAEETASRGSVTKDGETLELQEQEVDLLKGFAAAAKTLSHAAESNGGEEHDV